MKHLAIVLAPLLFSALARGVETPAVDAKPWQKFQYKSEGIEVPAATADEPKVKAFGPETIKAAVKYLDDGAHHWVREKACVACHSTGVYMVERSALTPQLGKPSEEVLEDFIKKVPKTLGKPGEGSLQPIWRSSGLASWDKHVTGKLSEPTDRSLRHTLSILPEEGFYQTIKLVEIPYITTRFELTVQAARAFATAPGWLENLKDPELLAKLDKMKKRLREHHPVSDYERAMKLQLAGLMPDLVPSEVRESAKAMLWRQQLPDGGWSLRRMSDIAGWRQEAFPATERQNWIEVMDPTVRGLIENEPDAGNPGSDPYMTAFAIVLLRESGVPTDDPRIQRGVMWLKANQRVSGRWWMKSLYRDTYHYITFISTAQALRALALCGEIGQVSTASTDTSSGNCEERD
jgi:squalene-hopene/tetraprenyl-beta-curcumene cyclase